MGFGATMRRVTTFLCLCMAVFTADAGSPSRTPGTKLGSHSGIAVMYVTVLANEPGVSRIQFSARQQFGPVDGIEIELGITTLVVRDMLEGQYGFYDLWSTTNGSKVKLRGTLPEFQVKRDCMIYVAK